MSFARTTAFALAALLTLGTAAPGLAQDASLIDPAIAAVSPAEKIAARQDAMKQDGGLLRSAGRLSGADAEAAADTLIHNFANFPEWFSEDTRASNSDALPAVWENWDDFAAIFAAGLKGAQDMKAAATAGDAAAYGAALQVIGGTCGACHQKYRS